MKRKVLFTIIALMAVCRTYANDIAVKNEDGVTILYNYIKDGTELEVAYGYSGYYKSQIKIPESVTYMNITRKVTAIAQGAFSNCSGLTSINIPNSVTSIGKNAFADCSGLTSVTIPNSLTRIEDYTFWGCTGLTTVTIPNSVTYVGDGAFAGCSGLTSVTIPNSLTRIEDYTFWGCTGLTTVTIPNSVTTIGDMAFAACSGLTSVTIPNSVKSIGECAFAGLGITAINIPNSVTTIGDMAFAACSGLTSVTIPNSVKSIGNKTFIESHALTSVISEMVNPCTISDNCFDNDVFYNSTLYVPKGTKETYKSMDYWNKFINIEEGVPSEIGKLLSRTLKIQASDGFINVSGIDDEQRVTVYELDGKQVASANASNGTVSLATNLKSGKAAVVKVGDKTVKVMMQ